MPSIPELVSSLIQNIVYDIGKYWIVYFIMIGAGHVLIRSFTERLRSNKEAIVFWIGCFVLLLGGTYLAGARDNSPNLIGSIQSIITGSPSSHPHDVVAVLTISIANTGGMQTFVKSWDVKAEMNSRTYQGEIITAPSDMSFDTAGRGSPGSPTAVIHKAVDNIVVKGTLPIQPGALLAGDLFVRFPNTEGDAFKPGGVKFTLSFEDVLSKHYEMNAITTAQFQLSAPSPGLNTQMVCPLPDNLRPPVNNPSPSPSLPYSPARSR